MAARLCQTGKLLTFFTKTHYLSVRAWRQQIMQVLNLQCAVHRFVESNSWKAFRDTGEPKFGEFGTPLPSLWKSVKNIFMQVIGLGQGFTDNSNVR